MCFQKRFDILFKESNLSQEEFGKILAVTKNQIFNWRSGSGEPDTKMLVGIAKKCNVSVEWLLGSSTLRTPKDYEKAELGDLMEKVIHSIDDFKAELKKYSLKDKE